MRTSAPIGVLVGLLISWSASAQPVTTRPNISGTLTQCAANTPVVGNGSGLQPICWPSGALGSIASVTSGTGVNTALAISVGSAGAFVTLNGALGTPLSGVATNLTGTAAGLTAGNVTTNANLTGPVTSVGNATAIGANQVTRAMEAQGVARSVIGVTGNATANVADIQGATNQVLRVNGAGTALAFGAIDLSQSAAVTGNLALANIATIAADTLLGNFTESTAVPTAGSINNCANALTYSTSTHAFGCNATAGTGTVTSVSVVTANGVSGSVATATSTPAITLTLGAITPTTVNGNTITTGTGTLTLGSATLNAGAGGTLASAAYKATGTSGNTVPLLDGTNTWTNLQTHSSGVNIAGGSFAAGTIYQSAVQGLSIALRTGSTNDFALFTPGGAAIMNVATGTTGVAFLGTLSAVLTSTSQTNVTCYNSVTGLFTYQTWATGCLSSSERFKRDVANISRDRSLDIVSGLAPVSYRYRPEMGLGDETHVGFTAEQVATVDKSLVEYEKDGKTPRAVKYQELAPIFAGAIQALSAKIDKLETRLGAGR